MLTHPAEVEDALEHFAEAYEPRSAAVGAVRSRRPAVGAFPFRSALLDRLDERTELRCRVALLDPEERAVVVGWYVRSDRPDAIARAIGCSTRHVYRLRQRAVERLAALGRADEFDDVDVAEFIA